MNGATANSWRGGKILYRCAGDGTPTADLPNNLAPSLGATIGGRTVIAEGEALVAYDRRGG